MVDENKITESGMSKEVEAKYNEIFSGSKTKKQDEAYLPPKEDEDVEEPETLKETEEVEEKPEADLTTETKEDEYEDVPERLTLAGRSAGFSDEKIIKLAEESPEVLEALANFREQLVEKQKPEPTVKPIEKEPEPEKLEPVTIDTTSIEDESTRKLVETLVAGQNKLIEKFNKSSVELANLQSRGTNLEQRQQDDFNLFVDGVLDEESKTCKDLGNSTTLTPGTKMVRSEVFEMALVFNKTRNKPIEQCLRDAVKAYKGLYGPDTKTEEDLRIKLNAQKKRITARPGGKRTEKTYKNTDEKAMDAMVEKGREIGFDW